MLRKVFLLSVLVLLSVSTSQAKLDRATFQVFGSSGATANFGKFGSATAGSPVTTRSIATIQSLSAWSIGWAAAVTSGNRAPYLEDLNSFCYVIAYELGYLFQEGIPEYDSGTTYNTYSIVKKVGSYQVYGSVVNNNTGQPLTGGLWTLLGDLSHLSSVATMRSINGIIACNGSGTFSTVTIGSQVPSPTGTGASGTWGISITGNAGTANSAVTSAALTHSLIALAITPQTIATNGTSWTAPSDGILMITAGCNGLGAQHWAYNIYVNANVVGGFSISNLTPYNYWGSMSIPVKIGDTINLYVNGGGAAPSLIIYLRKLAGQ